MDTPQQPEQQQTIQARELNPTEMMFLVSAYFYIEASALAQQALESKNPDFIVIKQENNPTVRAEIDQTTTEREEVSAQWKPELECPGPEDGLDANGKPVNH